MALCNMLAGSSPRVWGQVEGYRNYHRNERIIPTRMGTSETLTIILTILQDHPHAYGDKASITSVSTGVLGSSPRVWGQAYGN